MKIISAIICIILAVLLTGIAILNIINKDDVTTGYAVGSFLPVLLFLGIGIHLFKKVKKE